LTNVTKCDRHRGQLGLSDTTQVLRVSAINCKQWGVQKCKRGPPGCTFRTYIFKCLKRKCP